MFYDAMPKPNKDAETNLAAISPKYDIRAEIGPRLLMVRKLIDENRTRIAESYEVGHVRWRGWEIGEYYPDPGVMAAFCRDWGVTMDWIYLGRLESLPEKIKTLMYIAYPKLLQEQAGSSLTTAVAAALHDEANGASVPVPVEPAKGRRRRGSKMVRAAQP